MTETETGQTSEEAQKLICPLLLLRPDQPRPGSQPKSLMRQSECLGTECAWWEPVLGLCAALVAAASQELLAPKIVRATKAELERLEEVLLAQGLNEAQVQEAIKVLVEG